MILLADREFVYVWGQGPRFDEPFNLKSFFSLRTCFHAFAPPPYPLIVSKSCGGGKKISVMLAHFGNL